MHLGNHADAEPFTTLDGSTIRELAGPVSLPTANQSLAEATIPVGGATTAHRHHVTEELYYVTHGRGRMRIEDEERDVRVGDCVVIPPGAAHKLTNTGDEELAILCCCAPPYADADTELLEDAAA
ncbi:cupin domain-containing protein [Patulibacter brassicae]|uniref:Cupin domain-containing protein n=1 Tax=Patulibacter brassicae TaxID=1705717 RepID=A0ABU4VJ51_9ACTN|nr:cupin domain-containing protein [Patulibacter brassicae]MDX8150946.1 cupin domain-containing protein [Patulibacter brassicae]